MTQIRWCRRDRHPRESGQATVEFALIIPLVFVVFVALVQVTLVAYAQLGVSHLAREAARSLAIDPSADIGHLTEDGPFLGTDDLNIQVLFETSPISNRETVSVTVTYEVRPLLSIFKDISDHFLVQAEIKMLVES